MGRSTPAQFARKMHRASTDMRDLPKRNVRAGSRIISAEVDEQLDVAAPSRRLNVGRKGVRIGVTTKRVSDEAVMVKMVGPAHLIEGPTKAHRIPRTTGRGRNRRGDKKPLYIPGIGFRAKVNHPGTRGKYPWRKGVAKALPKVKVAANIEYAATLKRALR